MFDHMSHALRRSSSVGMYSRFGGRNDVNIHSSGCFNTVNARKSFGICLSRSVVGGREACFVPPGKRIEKDCLITRASSSEEEQQQERTMIDRGTESVTKERPTSADAESMGAPSSSLSSASEIAVLAEATKRITMLGRKGKPREAVAELANLARAGVQPDTQSATALLDACVRNKKLDMAESVFQELFSELLQPDEITFSVMLRGYGDVNPPRWTAISSTLASMERDYGIMPTTATYNALLEVAARTNDEARGYEIIYRMRDVGVLPDEFTVEAVRQRKSLRSMLRKTFDL